MLAVPRAFGGAAARFHVYQRGRREGNQVRHSRRCRHARGVAADLRLRAYSVTREEIADRWNKAQSNPIPPKVVDNAPVHEVVYQGLLSDGEGRFGCTSDSHFHTRLRLRPVHHGVTLVHKRSGDRHHQRRQLPRSYQKRDANRRVFSRGITAATIGASARSAAFRCRPHWS